MLDSEWSVTFVDTGIKLHDEFIACTCTGSLLNSYRNQTQLSPETHVRHPQYPTSSRLC